jgi:hypothetical protein
VRFWKDVEGQEKRALVRERVCLISGPGSLNRSERERRAKEIITNAEVDTAQYFNRVVKQHFGVTFKEQSKVWLEQSQTRKRKPIRATTVPTIQAALDKWILPEVGHLPLYETAKYAAMKALVAKMNGGRLSSQTVNSYFRVAARSRCSRCRICRGRGRQPFVSSQVGCEQVGPSYGGNIETAEAVDHGRNYGGVCQGQESEISDDLDLAASTGCRIGDLLGLEIKDLLDDCTHDPNRSTGKGNETDPGTQNGELCEAC